MPTSLLDQIPWVTNLVETISPAERRTVLEVGPGSGMYGAILRAYVNDPPDTIDAVEIWLPYIERFNLGGIYGRVFLGDALAAVGEGYDPLRFPGVELAWHCYPDRWQWVAGTVGATGGAFAARELIATYDVIVMGDVIEHFPKDLALVLLDAIPGRVVICTPVGNEPCAGEGYENPAEAHVSHWTEGDWRAQEKRRPLEAMFKRNDGWLVRLGPLPT